MAAREIRPEGSYRTMSLERATAADAMRAGVISCPPETSLRQVAQIMATEHIHSVVVDDGGSWRVLGDTDLLRARSDDLDTARAGDAAAGDAPTVTASDPLDRAAEAMAEHGVTHVLVLGEASGRPIGVLSTLDVAGVLAWGRA